MGLADIHASAGRTGFVTAKGVRGADVRLQTFRRHAHRLEWEHRRRGIWIPPGVELDHRQRAMEAVSGLGAALVTGRSALLLYGVIQQAPDAVELLVPANQHLSAPDDVCIHRTVAFASVRFQHRRDLRLAAIARAFADAAGHSTVKELCVDIATSARLRLCTLPLVAHELQVRARFPGRRNLRLAYGLLAGELTHSASEREGRRHLRAAGLRPHRQPLAVEAEGRLIGEIDIPFIDVHYGVEVDGPHHLLPDVAAADRMRDRQLNRVGWSIDRFYWFEIEERPEWFVSEVRRGLDAARQRAAIDGVNRA